MRMKGEEAEELKRERYFISLFSKLIRAPTTRCPAVCSARTTTTNTVHHEAREHHTRPTKLLRYKYDDDDEEKQRVKRITWLSFT